MTGAHLRRPSRKRLRPSAATQDPIIVHRRAVRLAYKRSFTPAVSVNETVGWREHEYAVLHWLWSQHQERDKYWTVINKLGERKGTHHRVSRPERRAYLAVVQRLINEGKIYRNCRLNELMLTPKGGQRIRELVGLRS